DRKNQAGGGDGRRAPADLKKDGEAPGCGAGRAEKRQASPGGGRAEKKTAKRRVVAPAPADLKIDSPATSRAPAAGHHKKY
ncbi:MAG: hypothetical protein K5767_03560, partial [Clostridia bacterium]|nr:hypothetical protein [Clostridia bacterium]